MLFQPRSILAPLVLCSVAWAAGCGSKLDPGLVESTTPSAVTPVVTAPVTAPVSGDSNDTASSPNTTATAPVVDLCGTSYATIGYAATAKATIATNCATSSCHGTGGSQQSMATAADAEEMLNSSGLSQINSGEMPPGGDLSDDAKCIITKWASGGYLP